MFAKLLVAGILMLPISIDQYITSPQGDAAERPRTLAALYAAFEHSTSETEACFAQHALAHPRLGPGLSDYELGQLVVEAGPSCAAIAQHMMNDHDLLYGTGSGERYFFGDFLNQLGKELLPMLRQRAGP